MAVLWALSLYSVIDVYQRLRDHIALMTETAKTSETPVNLSRLYGEANLFFFSENCI